MGLLDFFTSKSASVPMPEANKTPFNDFWFMDLTGAGFPHQVSVKTAASVSAVYSCCRVLSDTLSSLTLQLYAQQEFQDHYLLRVLNKHPNPLMSAPEFWQVMAFNAALHGEAYAEVVPTEDGSGGLTVELWPLPPHRITIERSDRAFELTYNPDDGKPKRIIPLTRLFRISNMIQNGNAPIACLDSASAAIKFAAALQTHGAEFFKNSARPSGVLTTPRSLSETARKRLSKMFNQGFSGAINAGKVPILEEDFKFSPITSSNTDSQYSELRREQVREIARFWRIPLYMLGESTGTKGDIEQQAIEFVRYTLRPWVKRIEEAICRDLLTDDEQLNLQYKFDLDTLLRGDSQTRARNYVLWRTAGIASVNEIRDREGLSIIDEDWADDPLLPLNSNRAADTVSGGTTSTDDGETAPDDEGADNDQD